MDCVSGTAAVGEGVEVSGREALGILGLILDEHF